MSLFEQSQSNMHSFLNGGGNMGELMRSMDWQSTGFGNPVQWSSTLKAITATVLASPFLMHISWGMEFLWLYSEGYRLILCSQIANRDDK